MKAYTIFSSAQVLTGLLGSMTPKASPKLNSKRQPAASLTSASGVTCTPLAGGSSISYSSCLNPTAGNDVTSSISAPLTAFLNDTLGSWVFDGKYEGGKHSAGPNDLGFRWVQNGKGTGTWSLAKTIATPFVISLKAGNTYTAYYFDGNTLINSGTWTTFDQKELSHASIFVGKSRLTPEEPKTTVSEPASTAALALVDLSAVGLVRKEQA
ncbi:hypothetical protein IQ265_21790 [Nodosilinea sp. LEGE 06152]|uniref:hypothetical protein n=1 Tax=Nodosilinea sp. LEGE 06152 TaxID=2777966 RepID=UPI00187E8C6C|nr:hypothetical protein [Nodosilinea sp. LEGE 06152]MBE9159441.1 hypothetical protein [Nodosilinea sp. LEGE 06152]